MNLAFYESLDRLPLGTAVALEFAGPVLVAAFGSRSVRDVAALLLVVSGVVLIADVRWAGSMLGVLFALSAAVLRPGYVVLGTRAAQAGPGVDGLTVRLGVAAVVLSPLALGTGPLWASPRLLVVGVGIGVLSTVVPFVLDQVVLRRMGQSRSAQLLALLAVTATAIGLLVLRQVPTPPEVLGILAVVCGLTIRTRREGPSSSAALVSR